MRAVRLLALHFDLLRSAAEAVAAQLRGVHVGDHQGGMRRGGAGRVAPFRRCRRETRRNSRSGGRGRPTAPSTACRHARSGRRPAAAARRNRPAARCARPAAAGSRRRAARTGRARRVPAWVSTRSISAACSSLRAVEQRQPAIAVPQHAQGGGHPLDRGGERGRRLRLGGLQQGADLGQVLQRGEMRGGAALGMAAIGQHLAADLLRQEAQRAGQERRVVRHRDGGGDQAFERGERRGRPAPRPAARRTAPRASETSRAISRWRNSIVGGGGEEIIVAEPGGDARARSRRAGAPAARRVARRSIPRPARGRAAGPHRCRARAGRAAR